MMRFARPKNLHVKSQPSNFIHVSYMPLQALAVPLFGALDNNMAPKSKVAKLKAASTAAAQEALRKAGVGRKLKKHDSNASDDHRGVEGATAAAAADATND